ncbi:MAG TPA: MarR family winged helix-turn-helix transcriptional regulator [Thermoleophilaceae bacterium]|jgi:DNA-binding MarR family transcriptional regulator
MAAPTKARTSATSFELAADAFFGMQHAIANVVRPIDNALNEAHGTNLTGYEVLLRLARMHEGGASVRYLSDQVLISPSRVSRVVDELVSRGLLERALSPQDGRLSLVRLTAGGRDELAGMQDTFERALRSHFVAALTAEQVEKLVDVAQSLGAPHCPPRNPS